MVRMKRVKHTTPINDFPRIREWVGESLLSRQPVFLATPEWGWEECARDHSRSL